VSPSVKIVFDFLKEKISSRLARCPNLKALPRKGGRSSYQLVDLSRIIVDNRPDKAHEERVFNGLMRYNLRHSQRLSLLTLEHRTKRPGSRQCWTPTWTKDD
jgi:hypothetical protein